MANNHTENGMSQHPVEDSYICDDDHLDNNDPEFQEAQDARDIDFIYYDLTQTDTDSNPGWTPPSHIHHHLVRRVGCHPHLTRLGVGSGRRNHPKQAHPGHREMRTNQAIQLVMGS